MVYRILVLAAAIALAVLLLLGIDHELSPLATGNASWVVRADQPLVAGGYGDNFCYSGANVRPLHGVLELRYDPVKREGTLTVTVETTSESGALRLAADKTLQGQIQLVSQIGTADRVLHDTPIYGDTGRGGPAFPQTLATLAGWSRFDLAVNSRTTATGLAGEWSIAQALRRSDGSIRQSGLVYSPLLRDKTGFANPKEIQLILLVHSDEADAQNAPPYTLALDLVFTQVTIEENPTQSTSQSAAP